MLIAHLADLHLGYRAYHRLAQGGINARERDVALAFRAALDKVVALKPELIVFAGDIFHSVRPSNAAIADAFRQFARLHARLPESRIVLIAGNHDSPRSTETGSILRLFAEIPGITVMDQEARTVYFPELRTSVLGVPHTALAAAEQTDRSRDSDADINVLVLHAQLRGGAAEQKLRYISEYGGAEVDLHELHPEEWDYVALGHYHIATELAPNMWYAGGIERTSSSVWEEKEDKGFLTFDTETRIAQFHPVPTREVIDLPRISALRQGGDALYLDAADIDARIQSLVEAIPGGLEGKIVRLVLHDIPRDLFRELDHRTLREYRSRALHFHLDARRPESQRIGGVGANGLRRTLEQEIDSFLTEQWTPTSSEIQRTRLLDLAHLYLAETRLNDPAEDAEPEVD